MSGVNSESEPKRQFAREVVIRLREAGHEALWAGGCVRDDLLGRTPGDFDVATSATPDQVIGLFGKRRTVPVGVSFGVVMVLGANKKCGQVEVATFRTDGDYLDGRRPESVKFCSPEEDARRRDFTINGMFYDPVAEQVIDYVGGQQDLQQNMLRAIGDPAERFAEDKLRMLRAVRFAATYGLILDEETAAAVQNHASQIIVVSAERIAAELKRMLAHPARAAAFQLLVDLKLADVLLPEIAVADAAAQIVSTLRRLNSSVFEPAMAAVLKPALDRNELRLAKAREATAVVAAICRRLKFSNAETEDVCWLLKQLPIAEEAHQQPWHITKPLLADARSSLLIDLLQADHAASERPATGAEHLKQIRASLTSEQLNPPPLIDGQDLHQTGLPPGKIYAQILQRIRRDQLDEVISSRDQALQHLQSYVDEHRSPPD